MPVSGPGWFVKGKSSFLVLSSHSLARKYLYCCNVCLIVCYSAVAQCSKLAFCSPFVPGVIATFFSAPPTWEHALGTCLSSFAVLC